MMSLSSETLVESRVGGAHRISLQYFLDEVLPPLHPNLNVDKVLATIKRSGKKGRRPITKDGRWRGLTNSSDATCMQKKLARSKFSPFRDIVQATAKAGALHGAGSSLQLLHNSVQGAKFRFTEPQALPDAFLVTQDFARVDCIVTLKDVSVAGDYTSFTDSRAQEEIYAKMHQSLAYMLRDPRRRFAFGYVLRNTLLEIWYCDKEQVLVSEPIEWVTDHRSVVHVFLGLLFAEPQHLGWDPTVALFKSPVNESQYEFTVEDRDGTRTVYRSLDLLFSIHPDAAAAKATHVWKAIEVRDGVPRGEPVVLKDVWRHEELGREGDNIEAVWRDSDREGARDVLSRGLLTVLHHGDVVIRSKSGREPPQLDYLRLHLDNAIDSAHERPLKDSRIMLPTEPVELRRDREGRASMQGRRIHYRIVFKEICTPLSLASPIPIACNALADVSEVIKVLHESGWVHRDISLNNVLLTPHGHAKLTDFEFAKRSADDGIPEAALGTPAFLSIEVFSQDHVFRPQKFLARIRELWDAAVAKRSAKTSAEGPDQNDEDDDDDGASNFSDDLDLTPSPYPPFHFRSLHDLESLWWLIAFLLFRWDADQDTQDESDIVEAKRRCERDNKYTRIFGKSVDRGRVITDEGFFHSTLAVLRPRTRRAGMVLEKLREQLVSRYTDSEQDCESMARPVAEGLHDAFAKAFRDVRDILAAAELAKPTRLKAASRPATRKRCVRELDGGDDDDSSATRISRPPAKRTRA